MRMFSRHLKKRLNADQFDQAHVEQTPIVLVNQTDQRPSVVVRRHLQEKRRERELFDMSLVDEAVGRA